MEKFGKTNASIDAVHGWAVCGQDWQVWLPYLPGDWQLSALNRGYMKVAAQQAATARDAQFAQPLAKVNLQPQQSQDQAPPPMFPAEPYRILVTHSFGLHL